MHFIPMFADTMFSHLSLLSFFRVLDDANLTFFTEHKQLTFLPWST